MKQKARPAFILLVLIAALSMGCNRQPPKPQAVVINVEAVVKATGIDEQLKARMEAMKQQLSQEMKELSEMLNKEIEDKNAALGDSPSQEDQKAMQTLRGQAFTKMRQVQTEGNKRIAKETSEVRQSYLDEIMSVAADVAREKGASVVLKAAAVFWSEGTVDITDQVITRMSVGKDEEPVDIEHSEADKLSFGQGIRKVVQVSDCNYLHVKQFG